MCLVPTRTKNNRHLNSHTINGSREKEVLAIVARQRAQSIGGRVNQVVVCLWSLFLMLFLGLLAFFQSRGLQVAHAVQNLGPPRPVSVPSS